VTDPGDAEEKMGPPKQHQDEFVDIGSGHEVLPIRGLNLSYYIVKRLKVKYLALTENRPEGAPPPLFFRQGLGNGWSDADFDNPAALDSYQDYGNKDPGLMVRLPARPGGGGPFPWRFPAGRTLSISLTTSRNP
jgi:hypothetical protein